MRATERPASPPPGPKRPPGTTFQGNTAADNAEAGFYVGDSPEAHAQVSGNEAWGNEFGLFFRSASNGEATSNVADGNCLGVLVLADAPGPATGWTLRDNEVTENNKRATWWSRSAVGASRSSARRTSS